MSLTLAHVEARQQALGEFLRARRERLMPGDVGLPVGVRRRTPGLRREELALIAGVGVTWYTWLEQGRDVRPSTEVLGALARALRLDEAETRYLFVLSDRPVMENRASGVETLGVSLTRILESLTVQPAYVIGRRWDILGWNRAAAAVFGDYGRLKGDERNVLHLLFANAGHRRLLIDWETIAPVSLAMFRAESARYSGDPDFERLVATLKAASPEFRAWWPKHDVLRPLPGKKLIRHPRAGRMAFEYSSLAATDASDQKLIVFTPAEDGDTAARIARLLAGRRR